ncbi:MAG TPA: nitrogenase molybdenum-iron cofactor biosynthesis protein, partial [Pyrodictiaceae archaeon]|nr:nitrogenase molybdenum-iron cofactor biosynthesis protein [Pyrodictiaceae archaeon]
KKAHDLGLIVKINSVLIPEINMDHIVEIAKTFKDVAHLQNIIPLIPLYKMKELRPPTCEEIKNIREKCEKYLPQFRACQQCRSDAVGLLSEKKLNIYDLKHFSH